MAMTLDDFLIRIRSILEAAPGPEGRRVLCGLVQEALRDELLMMSLLPDDGPERRVVYEDPVQGFTVVAHVYQRPKTSPPHDHGTSWAIYGQAAGQTLMTDWECITRPSNDTPGTVRRVRDYALVPGDVELYEPGALHSPRRDGPTRLLRVEGANMERMQRAAFIVTEEAH
jgi:predicted metal-dependent enzyme (double-stranded beta helix superfamily)